MGEGISRQTIIHIKNMSHCGNYRRFHGKHAYRWKHWNRAKSERIRREAKLICEPIIISGWRFSARQDGGITMNYIGESED